MKSGYVYIWEYIVKAEHADDFLRAYAPDGEWVKLFLGRPGYKKTELLRDSGNPLRFVTIDFWEDASSWQAFRREKSKEFESLDQKCETFTVSEKQIGLFEPIEKAM